MNWTVLAWILLYFVVGWVITEAYDLDDNDIWKVLIFLGWPILVGIVLVIVALLFLLGFLCVADEIFRDLFHERRRTWTWRNSKEH